MRIAYLGPRGTFSEDALRAAVGDEEVEPAPAASVYDAILAVREGEADRALVPFENSIEGAVTATLDTLAFDADGVTLVGEYDLPIRHCLIAREEMPLERIEVGDLPPAAERAVRPLHPREPARRPRSGRRPAPPRPCGPSPSPISPGLRWGRNLRPSSTAPPCCVTASRTSPTTSPASSGSRRTGPCPRARVPGAPHLSSRSSARTTPARWSTPSRSSRTEPST